MTGAAGLEHRALMGVGVAGEALRLVLEKRARRVTAIATRGDNGVPAGKGEPRFFLMVEIYGEGRTKLSVPPLVFDMADFAVAGDIPVNALFEGYPVSHRLVAGQAIF